MRFVLVGNYGAGNLGDEALREYFLQAFPEAEWRVLSASPSSGEYPRLPTGVRSLLTTPWWRTLGEIRRADGVVFGGGSLFTDIESVRACAMWWAHAAAARLFGKPVFLAYQGIGPFRTHAGRVLARSALKRAAFLSVRDRRSGERAAGLGAVDIVESFDPVFSLLQDAPASPRRGTILAVIPRAQGAETFRMHARWHARTMGADAVRVVSLQPDHPAERRLCEALADNREIPTTIHPVRTLEELLAALEGASAVLTQRYHGALAALALGIPLEIWHQKEGDKLAALRDIAGIDPSALHALVEHGEKALLTALQQAGTASSADAGVLQ